MISSGILCAMMVGLAYGQNKLTIPEEPMASASGSKALATAPDSLTAAASGYSPSYNGGGYGGGYESSYGGGHDSGYGGCYGRPAGSYGDASYDCKTYQVCQSDGRLDTLYCPPYTRFNNYLGVCDWHFKVDAYCNPLYKEEYQSNSYSQGYSQPSYGGSSYSQPSYGGSSYSHGNYESYPQGGSSYQGDSYGGYAPQTSYGSSRQYAAPIISYQPEKYGSSYGGSNYGGSSYGSQGSAYRSPIYSLGHGRNY